MQQGTKSQLLLPADGEVPFLIATSKFGLLAIRRLSGTNVIKVTGYV